MIQLPNATSLHFDLVSDHAPIFSQRSYTFTLHLSDETSRRSLVGQVTAQPYDVTRSHLVYQFLSPKRNFFLDLDQGTIDYLSDPLNNGTIEHLQIIARDLIYQQSTTVNITIHIVRSKRLFPLLVMYWHQSFSPMLPPGSIVFRFNRSSSDDDRYSLQDAPQNLFTIDATSGAITSLDFLSDSSYTLKIHLSPQEHLVILHLSALLYKQHPPLFLHLPWNLTISSDATFVTKLSATDSDLSDHQSLEYYLMDHDQREIFTVDRRTGVVTLKRTSLQTSWVLNVAVSDGWYLTKDQLRVTIENYSSAAPEFSTVEYVFPPTDPLGQIVAYDSDWNDRIRYRLYLEPEGVEIDPYSGWITSKRNLSSLIEEQTIEFYASASDRVHQIAYTTIRIVLPTQPRFSSNLYFLSLMLPLKIPSEIFQFELVDAFNQPLSSARFGLDHTHLFQVEANKLILRENLDFSKIYYLNIYGYWKHYSLQSSLRIVVVAHSIGFDRSLYDFRLDPVLLKPQDAIKTFLMPNVTLKILSTPLTRNDCIRNFYIRQNLLVFHQHPIRSQLCLFEVQAANQNSIATSQIKVSFIHSLGKPRFSSDLYYFYPQSKTSTFRVFAKSSYALRYSLEANLYGLNIHSTTGVLSFDGDFDTVNQVASVQLTVYARDVDTKGNASAKVRISFRRQQLFEVPRNRSTISICSNRSLVVVDDSLPGKEKDFLQGDRSETL